MLGIAIGIAVGYAFARWREGKPKSVIAGRLKAGIIQRMKK